MASGPPSSRLLVTARIRLPALMVELDASIVPARIRTSDGPESLGGALWTDTTGKTLVMLPKTLLKTLVTRLVVPMNGVPARLKLRASIHTGPPRAAMQPELSRFTARMEWVEAKLVPVLT